MRRAVPLAWLGLVGACYEVPGSDVAEVIAISAAQPSLPGNGFSTVDLELRLDADADLAQGITVAVSDGTINFAATGADARTLTLKLPRGTGSAASHTKTATVPYRAGRTPGVVEVTAAVAEITARTTLVVTPQPPTVMFSEPAVSSLKADGTTRADITVFLLEAPPAQVSFATQVASRVCCLDPGGALIACGTQPPLRVTRVVELTSGNAVTVAATTEPYTGPDLQVAVVSAVVTDAATTPACTAADGKTASSAVLTLHP